MRIARDYGTIPAMNMQPYRFLSQIHVLALGIGLLTACNPTEPQATTPTSQPSTEPAATAPAPADAGSSTAGKQGGCMAQVREQGLRVVTSPDYPPYEFIDDKNEIDGFDIHMMEALGKAMGVPVKIEGQSFEGLIPSLLSGRADVIAAGLSITEERKKSVAFTMPYDQPKNILLVKSSDTSINGETTLAGKKIAVQIGSIQESVAKGIKGAEVKSYNLVTESMMALEGGQVDAMVVDDAVARNFLSTKTNLREAGELPSAPKALAVRPDCTDLVQELDAAFEKIKADGQLDALKKQWFDQSVIE
ncbi:basic amino acid ABC transporter substrate-binding protein [Deinococcus lacus]|uniref:Basic amino acid ABC transporter substrate-binding protein n=1 Tax=Deinococcus lacus TaxID=392561 RepID=A0ABW1YAP8_9DEIO